MEVYSQGVYSLNIYSKSSCLCEQIDTFLSENYNITNQDYFKNYTEVLNFAAHKWKLQIAEV